MSGVGALAATLGTIMPVIGAGGFAAVASAIRSVAGSQVLLQLLHHLEVIIVS